MPEIPRHSSALKLSVTSLLYQFAARDAGDVLDVDQGSGTPGFQPEGLTGGQKVTSPGTGVYCLTPDARSTQSNTSLVLSLGGPAFPPPGPAPP